MKSKLYFTLLAVAILAFLVIGCGEASEKTKLPSDKKVEEVSNTFETVKTNYLKGAETLVSDWDDKLKGLEEKKNALPEIARKPLEEPFNKVMAGKDELKTKFSDLKGAGKDTFDVKKDAFEGSINNLTSNYDNIMGMF